ncbi:MAG: Rne/Rng family ribonuclease [candidate division KSB1 bacterium]|jgi:ribonuclease G|nr:Rne/Rng family ribonuclease [candidate division KSB1 bacterium]
MRKDIIINSGISETRIAILESNRLAEIFLERPENERTVGDIYLGKVVNVVKGMRAAFVDIGQKQDAFLHFSDVGETFSTVSALIDTSDNGDEVENIPVGQIKVGQEILVQIIKEPISTKGSRITTQISIPGRFCVLVPNSRMVGISRKIDSVRERRRLKKTARSLKPKGCGLIVRTVAEGKSAQILKADIDSLVKTWDKLQKKLVKMKPPSLAYKDMGMTSSVIRDLFTKDVNRLVVDSRKLFREITTYLKDVAPNLVNKIELYNKKYPIFDAFKIETEIEKSLARKVWMKSGGYIIFDHTEALVAIDVNSGKFMGRKTHEDNSLKINLEAAIEIARQLRLRDIGGIIVIDFIDMLDEANKRKLYNSFKRELKNDRAQANITPLSEFGLIEMTRERIRPSLLFRFSEICPTCHGIGRVTSKSTILSQIERWLKKFKSSSKEKSLRLKAHPEIHKYLTEGIRSRIRRIMWKYWLRIDVISDESLEVDEFKVFSKRKNTELTNQFKS